MTVTVDVSQFHLENVIDTCAIWNILSSKLLYSRTVLAKVTFHCSRFVLYECLYKKRNEQKSSDFELQKRLRQELDKGAFQIHDLDIEDLQDVEILAKRKKLGKGELSSIILAKKSGKAFLTDDRNARKLAKIALNAKMIQTTLHLVGWLYFIDNLSDGDRSVILQEHKSLGGAFRQEHFETMYHEALRCRLMALNAVN